MALDRKVLLGVGVVIVLLIGGLVGTQIIDRPRIESVDNDWGTVTSERTEVETDIVVDDPALLRLGDAVAAVEYTVSFNDITMASGQKDEVHLSGQRNTIDVTTWVDNDDIPRWWVSHIRNNETTTVQVNPDVAVETAGRQVAAEPWTRTGTFETDLLDPIETDEPREFSAGGGTVFVVQQTHAGWGNVTREQTPIHISMTVRNDLALAVPVKQVNYTIQMNGVVVGNGSIFEDRTLRPNRQYRLDGRTVIDNSKLDEWWVRHIRNDETTRLSVDFNASVDYAGREVQLPVKLVANETFQTNIFPREERG